ncbi:MAG: multidrug effflux MFS transporter [Amaricoccus sp.]|uniref:multidrug effflux MFS transporter n=1 Tax=Amaricoccus sp. TaxID=1872485 RepID=UPI0039E2BB80
MQAEGEATSAAGVWLDRRTPPHIVTVVSIAGIAALSLNVILPSLPSIAAEFGADYALVATAVSGYLGLTGVLQLGLGPLSDRYGRRPVLLVTGAIFLLASLGCAVAPNIAVFLACRMAQAAVASGLVLSRAIVRDMVPPLQAASLLGYVTMGMSLAPMVAPMLGGILDETFGWRSVFVFSLVSGAAVFALVWADLGETNARPSESLAAQFSQYPALLGSRPFWGYSLTATFGAGVFYAFLGGGPWVAREVLGMSPAGLGLHFGFPAFGYLVGNFLSGRYASRVGLGGMMLAGGVVTLVGVVIAAWLFLADVAGPLSFFSVMVLTGVGNGLVLPSANAGVVSVRPDLAGSASGLAGGLMIGGGALLSVAAGALVGASAGALGLVWLMLASAVLGVLATLDVRRRGVL